MRGARRIITGKAARAREQAMQISAREIGQDEAGLGGERFVATSTPCTATARRLLPFELKTRLLSREWDVRFSALGEVQDELALSIIASDAGYMTDVRVAAAEKLSARIDKIGFLGLAMVERMCKDETAKQAAMAAILKLDRSTQPAFYGAEPDELYLTLINVSEWLKVKLADGRFSDTDRETLSWWKDVIQAQRCGLAGAAIEHIA